MRPLKKPTSDAGSTFDLCISKVRNVALKSKFQKLRATIVAEADAYDVAAQIGNLHEIEQTGDIGGVKKEEMVKVYKNRMAKVGTPGREIYNELMIAPTNRRCPLCGQRDVSTLDHVLPESLYSLLVVVPVNLVPSCKDCNSAKKSLYPNCKRTQFFHPYYDNFDDGVWLEAEVDHSCGVAVLFKVVRPDSWGLSKFKRAQYHFKKLNLGKLYSSQAADELVGVKFCLGELYRAGGGGSVQEDLDRRARSYSQIANNSWQAALFRALAADEEFCNGGFDRL